MKFQLFFSTIIVATIFYSCSKNEMSAPQNNVLAEKALITDAGTKQTLILQPGTADGQDCYVITNSGDASEANGNFNYVPEIAALTWTNGGSIVKTRFFIRFDSLIKIPTTAKIVSATLYLYGLDNKSLVAPQGNSIYPGSPYLGFPNNGCYIERVTGPWNESTITWNTQPTATKMGKDSIAESDAQWHYNPEIDVTEMVKKMVAQPSTNYGFKIYLQDEMKYRNINFAASEYSDSSKHAKLKVDVYKRQEYIPSGS